MQTQTVFKAGNSNVVAIPKGLMREIGLKVGQKVVVEKNGVEAVLIKKAVKLKKKSVAADAEFKKWWREFLKENAGVLDELAVR